MKLKLYLRGLGAGIIVTTIMLSFAFHVKSSSDSLPTSTQATQAVNQTLASGKTEAQPKTEAKQTQQETQIQTQVQTQTQAQSQTQSQTQIQTQIQTQAQTQAQTAVSVVFENISSSEQAAQIIAQAGIVTDWKDFNSYLISNGYAVSIHNGTYSLHKGQDYESIAKTITGK